MALHGGRIAFAAECLIGRGEELPDLGVERALCAGAFCAYGGVFRIAVMEQVLCRKDIGALTRGCCLTIGGELHEKIVVVGITL